MAKKVYAIKEGYDKINQIKVENIIVNTWDECLKYVRGVKGARYKSFEDINEANKFLSGEGDVIKKEDNNYPKDCLHIYVDGSYNSITEEYSYGMVAVKNDIVLHIESGIGKSSSERNIRQIAGELEAAVRGVKYAISKGEERVVIFHDYIGICYHATGFWDRKEESSKIYYKRMQELMSQGIEIIFVKVDSHTGDLFNELADEKCKEKLGIDSDKIVEKWLVKNIIKVVNNEVKYEVEKVISKGFENIVIINDEIIESNELCQDEPIIDQITKECNELSRDQQIKVLDYIKAFNKL
jgi:ribonuclease HI